MDPPLREAEKEAEGLSLSCFQQHRIAEMAIPRIADALQGIELNGGIEPSPFPAKTKQAAGLVNGVETDLTSMYFSDKILITISQGGRLAQWV